MLPVASWLLAQRRKLTPRWRDSSGPKAPTTPVGGGWPRKLKEALPMLLVPLHSTAFSCNTCSRSSPMLVVDSCTVSVPAPAEARGTAVLADPTLPDLL